MPGAQSAIKGGSGSGTGPAERVSVFWPQPQKSPAPTKKRERVFGGRKFISGVLALGSAEDCLRPDRPASGPAKNRAGSSPRGLLDPVD
jgi:hypothetical protein